MSDPCPYCKTTMVNTGAPIWEDICPNKACTGHRDALFASVAKRSAAKGWRDISSAPRDGTEFLGGRWWQGRFMVDTLKFYAKAGDFPKLIHSRYRHRMDADLWQPLPVAPTPNTTDTEE